MGFPFRCSSKCTILFFAAALLVAVGLGLSGCTDTPGTAEGQDPDAGELDDVGDVDCEGELEECAGACVDTDTSTEHCGGCGIECETRSNAVAECVDGQCQWSCEAGWVDENGDLGEPGGSCEAECVETNGGVPQCDGRDNNCDGTIDTGFEIGDECTVGEGECENTGQYICSDDGTGVVCDAKPLEPQIWYEDADGDGYGNPAVAMQSCTQPDGYVDNDLDCDDTDPQINPDAEPQCDGRDNNCDGTVDTGFSSGMPCINDEGACDSIGEYECTEDGTDVVCNAEPSSEEQVWYEDADGDGFGNPDVRKEACGKPEGFVANDLDCDDTDPDVNPDAEPLCDGQDTNCDGTVDTGFAVGEACVNEEGECDSIGEFECNAEGTDVVCNAEPDDEPQTWYEDADGDGYGNPEVSVESCTQPDGYVANDDDCDDTDPTVNPGMDPRCDGRDTNCDGSIDTGFFVGEGCVNDEGECDSIGEYVCTLDGLDVECDAEPDDSEQTWYRDADGDGFGDPNETKVACEQPDGYVANDADCDDSDPYVYPGAPSRCDGKDNNCDGVVDTAFQMIGDSCVNDDGLCDSIGTYECTPNELGYQCDAEPNNDQQTWYRDADGDGYGDPNNSTDACEQPDGYVANDLDCDDSDPEIHPGAESRCDGQDNNCDGTIDTAFQMIGDSCVNDEGKCESTGEYKCTSDELDYYCDAVPNDDEQTWYRDADGDGYGDPNETKVACEQPDGYVANDLDCDDSDPNVYPDAPPRCDGKDTNCDGTVDHMLDDGTGWGTTTINLSSQSDSFPPTALATHFDDPSRGFCVAVYDESENRVGMAEIDHDGTGDTAVTGDNAFMSDLDESGNPSVTLADGVLVDVATRGSDCVALAYKDNPEREINTLHAVRFSDGEIQAVRRIAWVSLYVHDSETLAAGIHGREDSTNQAWIIGFTHVSPSGNEHMKFRALPAGFDENSSFTGEDVASGEYTGLSSPRDVGVGPSPRFSDDFLLTWQHTGSLTTDAGIYADRFTGSEFERQEEWNAIDEDYINPLISEVDSTVLRGVRDDSSYEYLFEELESSSVGNSFVIPSQSDGSFIGRDPVTETGADNVWWFVDPYGDEAYRIEDAGFGNYDIAQWTHSNVGLFDDLLAASPAEDGVSVLRMTSDNPFTFKVDHNSCH